MALSYVTYVGDGATTDFTFNKGYIQQSDVSVYLDGVLKTLTTDYTWFNATTVRMNTAPAVSVVVKLTRATQKTSRLVDFQDAGNLTEADLDRNSDQMFYLAQEAQDVFDDSALGLDVDDKWNAESKVMKNLANGVNANDAVNKAQVEAITAADAAAAAASATAAATSQAAAAANQTAAEAAQTAAETVYDNFDDRFLGSKASDPALDNDGNPLLTGALYWNSTNNAMRVYTGVVWQDVGSSTANITKFTATGGQTTFSGLDDNSKLLSYTPGYLMVFLNGVQLENTTDYVATTGTSIVLTSGTVAGDVLQGIGFGAFDVSTSYTKAESDGQFAPIARARKNLIINGSMAVWQRGTSATGPTGSIFLADRFYVNYTTADVVDVSRITYASRPTGVVASYYLLQTVTTPDTTMSATDIRYLRYRMEGYDAANLRVGYSNAQTVTLSFWHAHHRTGTYSVAFRNNAGTRSYIAEYTQSAADTWEKTTITLTMCTDGTWLTDVSNGLEIIWTVASGTTWQTTAGSWQAGDYYASTNQVNAVGATSDRFRLAQIQFEIGATATDFEVRTFEEELAMCQRYFEKSYSQGQFAGSTSTSGYRKGVLPNADTYFYALNTPFKVTKRSSPTVTWYSQATGTANRVRNETTPADLTVAGTADGNDAFTGTPYFGGAAQADQSAISAHWAADAEL